ncbi:MAG: hypothetical protein ACRD68_00605, partial [Pyrinomonadaceae bacterium]
MNRIPFFVVLVALVLCPAYALNQRDKQDDVSIARIKALVQKEYGVKAGAEVMGDGWYLHGDFNGDGKSDVAVIVTVEDGRAGLKKRGVKYINVDPYSRHNGAQRDPESAMEQNCLGVAIIHGTAGGYNT